MAAVTVTSAVYNHNNGQLGITFGNLPSTDVVDLSKFTFTGANGDTLTLSGTASDNFSSGTIFISLAAANQATADRIFNASGTQTAGGVAYNLAVLDDFDTSQVGNSPAITTIPVTVSGYALPTFTAATYSATFGTLVVTGSHLIDTTGVNNDITAAKLQLTGQGGTYTLTSDNVEVTSGTSFTVTLNSADLAAIKTFLNKNGTSALDATTFNLSALDNWNGITGDAIATTANVGITVSGFPNPNKVFNGVTLSADTGSSGTDFITNVAAQTISGTTSLLFTTGDFVQASVDGGTTWITGAYTATGANTPFTISGVTLVSSSTTLLLRVVNPTGAGPTTSKTYTLDQVVPTNTVATVVLPSDSGASTTDGITNVASQTITGTLAGALAAGELVQVSLDNGGTWNTATATVAQTTWSYAATFSAGSNPVQVRVADTAGNGGSATSKAVTLDTTAPVFVSAAVTGNSLVMTYGEALDAVNKPGNGTFAVVVGGTADAVTGVAVDSAAKTVTLTLTTAATAGQVVTVSYTDGAGDDANAIQDAAGNDAATIAAQAVTNNTAAPASGGGGGSPAGITSTAPAGGGTVTGTAGNDTLTGLDGKNIFITNGGKDTVKGGTGSDTVVVSGARSDYTLVHNSDGSFTLQSRTDANTTVSMSGVERINFNGQSLALDVTTNSAKTADMYTLALGRNPEDAGLSYWTGTLGSGLSDVDLAKSFVNSKEFATLYGSLSDTAFITQFYQNAFGRAPDAGGLAYFQDLLSHVTGNVGRANVLATFVDSSEMQAKLVGQVDQGIPLLASS